MAKEKRKQEVIDLSEMGVPFAVMGLMGFMGIATVVGMGMASLSIQLEQEEKPVTMSHFKSSSVINNPMTVEVVPDVSGEYEEVSSATYLNLSGISNEMTAVFDQLEGNNVEVIFGESVTLSPEDFVLHLPGENLMTLQYLDKPSMKSIGVDEVIVLVSGGGQTRQIVGSLSVGRESPDPVIEGVTDMEVLLGSTVSYRKGVVATDRFGQELDLEIDSSAVNLNKIGTYDVIYSVTDQHGLEAQVETTLKVYNNTENMVLLSVQRVLDQILKEDMSAHDKAYAIYKWTRDNIRYTSGGERDDMYLIAYNGFQTGTGDCYTYQAVAYFLLIEAGISVVPLERIDGTGTNHKWLAVNVGNGWYHFDACANSSKQDVFLYSDSEVRALTAVIDRIKGYSYHYFDYKTPNGIVMAEK